MDFDHKPSVFANCLRATSAYLNSASTNQKNIIVAEGNDDTSTQVLEAYTALNESVKEIINGNSKMSSLSTSSSSSSQPDAESPVIVNPPLSKSDHTISNRLNEDFKLHMRFIQNGKQFSKKQDTGISEHEINHTPLFSSCVQEQLPLGFFNQYGLLGIQLSRHVHGCQIKSLGGSDQALIYGNHGEPSSTFICGSQGSGKSHTLAAHVENCILRMSPIATLPHPLPIIAFHFDTSTSGTSTQHCELAYLCSAGVRVRVLVHSSNYSNMKVLYENLPGLPPNSPKPQVSKLKLEEKHLNIGNMMTMMNVKEDDGTPLYLAILYEILQKMAEHLPHNAGISYATFKQQLESQGFVGGQVAMLRLRLLLLESFLDPSALGKGHRIHHGNEGIWAFEPGSLTIIDLSSPFVSANDACAIFTVCLNIFMAGRAQSSRVVVLDEAHKFLTQSGEAEKLTESLISIIRQQRHLATRVMIATQEPTLDPRLLDLCSSIIVHRFSSPEWFRVLQKHLAGSRGGFDKQKALDDIFQSILDLDTGTALIFSPTAVVHLEDGTEKGALDSKPVFTRLKDGYVKVQIRDRLTADGGRSIVASNQYKLDVKAESVMSDNDDDSSDDDDDDEHGDGTVLTGTILRETQAESHLKTIRPTSNVLDPETPPATPRRTYTKGPAIASGAASKLTIQPSSKHTSVPQTSSQPLKGSATKAQLEGALRKATRSVMNKERQKLIKNSNFNVDFGVVRREACKLLGINSDPFVDEWKGKSKKIIHDEVEKVKLLWDA